MTWKEVMDQDIKLTPEVHDFTGFFVVGVKGAAYISTRQVTRLEAMFIR